MNKLKLLLGLKMEENRKNANLVNVCFFLHKLG